MTRDGTFSALRIPNFRWLWAGQLCHAGALWMEQIARPFLVLDITDGSAVHVGAVIGVRTLPQVLFGLWAGAVSDWFDRRRTLLIVKSSAFAVNVAFAALVVGGRLELWHVYLYSFVRGSLMAFDQPARQSLIPSIVPVERVTNAMALMSATQNTMRIVGASAGGLVYAAAGPEGAYSAIAAIYLGTVVSTFLLDVPTHALPEENGWSAMGRGIAEGLRFALRHSAIRGVLVLSAVYFTFGMSYMQVFLPLFADSVLEIGSAGFGALASLTGAGALVAAIGIARRPPTRLGSILPLLVGLFGAVTVAFALSTRLPAPYGVALPFLIVPVAGGLQTGFFSLGRSLMLQEAPEAMRGRVLSLLSLDRAFMAGGASAAGVLVGAIGVVQAQALYGSVCIVGAIAVAALSPGSRAGVDSTPAARPSLRRQ